MAKTRAQKKPAVTTETFPFDVINYFRDRADMAGYLDAAFLEDPEDAASFAHSLGDVCRAVGMADIAEKVGVGRESLYKSLNEDGNPSFATVVKVLAAVGMQFRVVVR